MASIKIARGTDPFKKYWWAILLVFGVIGAVVCMPAMNSSSGAAVVEESGLQFSDADSSLDSQDNPIGAQGGVVDLTMEGRKKKEAPSVSGLYQASAEPAAAASTAAATALATPAQQKTLADALKDVSRASAASAKVEAGGWGERAQRGFTAPKVALAAMSGLGGGGGGGSGARMASGGSGGSGSSSFGSATARVGSTSAKGLKDGSDGTKEAPTAMGRLNKAHTASQLASYNSSNDGARSGSGTTFDGGSVATRSLGGGGGGGGAGFYGSLDAAPQNLKGTDFSKINQKKVTPPPLPAANMAKENAELKKIPMEAQMTQMIASMVIGGLMSCVGL
jgi:hypothetical protein